MSRFKDSQENSYTVCPQEFSIDGIQRRDNAPINHKLVSINSPTLQDFIEKQYFIFVLIKVSKLNNNLDLFGVAPALKSTAKKS